MLFFFLCFISSGCSPALRSIVQIFLIPDGSGLYKDDHMQELFMLCDRFAPLALQERKRKRILATFRLHYHDETFLSKWEWSVPGRPCPMHEGHSVVWLVEKLCKSYTMTFAVTRSWLSWTLMGNFGAPCLTELTTIRTLNEEISFYKKGIHLSSRVQETCRLYAKVHWSLA